MSASNDKLVNACKEKLGSNLRSVIGFGFEGEIPNTLVVTTTLKFDDITKIKPVFLQQFKKSKMLPLIFTYDEIKNSTDVFPLEFLNIKYTHTVLYGENVLDKLSIAKQDVKRQLEFELRSKLIHLREHYLGIKKDSELRQLLKSATPSLLPLLYGLLFLADIKPKNTLHELAAQVNACYTFDLKILIELYEEKLEKSLLFIKTRELISVLEGLITLMDK